MKRTAAAQFSFAFAVTGGSLHVVPYQYRFSEVERLLEQGEKIEITKRKQVIGQLLPVRPASRRCPGFLARLHSIYGDRTLEVSSAQLLARERDRY